MTGVIRWRYTDESPDKFGWPNYGRILKEKKQDNNASFEGISEAEYNKRHMKALKDADPGLKLQASSTKRQASSKPEPSSGSSNI